MAKRVRVEGIVELVEQRVRFGDYTLLKMPTEAELAAEVGACRLTARRAMLKLVEKGVLIRPPNGRLRVNRKMSGPRRLLVGILSPSWVSTETTHFRVTMDGLAERFNATVRSMEFRHWDDAVFSEAYSSFDGVFVHPLAEIVPESWIQGVRASPTPVVMMNRDLSGHGIPSVDLTPVSAFQKIFDHFAALGHRRLDCFNSQPVDEEISKRIQQWNLWRAARDIEGKLINHPVKSFQDPMRHAYETVHQMLADGSFDSTAIFCTTTVAAEGVQRALYEAGIKVGVDVALSGANDSERRAWVNCPSLTTLIPADPSPYVAVCLEWIARGGRAWAGPLLMVPTDIPIFIGESTCGPASCKPK